MLREISQIRKDRYVRHSVCMRSPTVTLIEAESRVGVVGGGRGENGEMMFRRH